MKNLCAVSKDPIQLPIFALETVVIFGKLHSIPRQIGFKRSNSEINRDIQIDFQGAASSKS
jgi:hypothetical protein